MSHADFLHRRRALERAINHGIALLDALDAEWEDREPYLAGVVAGPANPSDPWGLAEDADTLEEHEDYGEDAESTLGAPERYPIKTLTWRNWLVDRSAAASQEF